MYLYGIFLIMTIAMLGGIIALLGDRVGMRVGKKRLSIFGLRPKYTSMLITVITGIMISGSTLLILSIISTDVRTALFRMKEIQAELVLKGKELKDLAAEASMMEARQRETDKLLKKTEGEYEKAVANLNLKQEELEKTRKELLFEQERLRNLVQVTKDLNEKIVGQEVEKERLFKEVQALSAEASLLRDNLKVTKTGRLIFLSGDILVVRVVKPGMSGTEIKEEIIEPMLLEANKIALERGARLEGKEEYALKVSKYQLDYISGEVEKLKQPGVIRLIAERNTVVFEPLYVSFQLFPNDLVFKKGEVIAEARVSPQLAENEIMDQILNLLLVVRKKALDRGMVSEGQYIGEIASLQEVPAIIKEIKGRRKESTIRLVAEDNIWRVEGPVKVGIEIGNGE